MKQKTNYFPLEEKIIIQSVALAVLETILD